ncbi:Extradiol ring-cleavage dioxygenase, class III enzyme, subunit B [Metarhizium album ARSEF 1941]|uniref:Extradiol ring-cleavage dioxygenase, class III enzyme, subunit B n=1 Tax=Metarhizium album (strain ARSEF 1941) TaxID=1081103 RepID=A0A0B2WVR9_METAS|nr:Extradiol ring-cleavage dioxygenase, class III enzyme, subunit B [Metarhizium album ARSEF 1941]KHN97552.1 Extradiol ring-cleavage dioxygenase, class III enzyme, subunit B [Metarhizium album ARSEF 1941]
MPSLRIEFAPQRQRLVPKQNTLLRLIDNSGRRVGHLRDAYITTSTTAPVTKSFGNPLRLRLRLRLRLARVNVHIIYRKRLITAAKMPVAPVIALSHGGGPLPVLGDEDHESIIYSLRNRIPKILGLGTPSGPRAIVLVTAHWSTDVPTVSSSAHHDLYYDYYGFPAESYSLKYPASGDAEVAREIKSLLDAEGLAGKLDPKRGWDHGVFIPMLLINPAADVPIVQVSVLESEDPERHLRMGAALARLREKNIAIIGSGFASLHNLMEMRNLTTRGPGFAREFKALSDEWNDALTGAATKEGRDERWSGLKAWRTMPHVDRMHPPRAGEHFMPLLVCAGAAGDGEKARLYKDAFMGVDIFTYYWGAEEVD